MSDPSMTGPTMTEHRHRTIRKALTVGAIAIAATVIGGASPVASAAPAAVTSVAPVSLLNDPVALAAVKEAAANGYAVPAKYAASCGAAQ